MAIHGVGSSSSTIGEAGGGGKSLSLKTDAPTPIGAVMVTTFKLGRERVPTGGGGAVATRRGRAPLHAVLAPVLGFALALLALSVPAENDDPMAVVRATTGELFARVQQQRDALRADPGALQPMIEQVLLPHVDLERTSRLVLGKYWRTATTPQRSDFMQQFRALLLRTYSTALIEFADIEVDYLDTRYSKDKLSAIVRTRVRSSNGRPDVTMDYRLGRVEDRWKVYDVIVGGVSLVTTYRTSFGNAVSRGGLDKLLRTMREHNDGGQDA